MENKESIEGYVRRVQAGDAAAFTPLVEAMYESLSRYCRSLCGNRELAEDLVQETFLKAYRSIHRLNAPASFPAWLFRSARNLHIDRLRNAHERHRSCADFAVDRAATPAREEAGDVHRVLERLPGADRQVLQLVDVVGHSYETAADLMRTTHDSVRSRLYRARRQFASLYRR